MATLFVGQNKIQLSTVDSTNNFAANLIKETNVLDGTVIMAENQTAGKGQQGSSWESEPGENLVCTYIFRPSFVLVEEQFTISMVAALAVQSFFQRFGANNVEVKWPNDILINGKKAAGILIENSLYGSRISYCIIGIGININQTSFGAGIDATSLHKQTGVNYIPEKMLEVLNEEMEKLYLQLKNGNAASVREAYLNSLFRYNIVAKYQDVSTGEAFEGRIKDVTKKGLLTIEDLSSNIREYYFKEVTFIY